jgi:hypothetical protein
MKSSLLCLSLLLLAASNWAWAQDDGFEIYIFAPEESHSWTQRFWMKPWEHWGEPTQYQFQIWTWPPHSATPQKFDPPAFRIRGYGETADAPWSVWYHEFNGVPNAQMWAAGANPPSNQGEFIWLTFQQGTVNSYPNPWQSVWSNTPSFVLQVQGYQGDTLKKNFDLVFVSPSHGLDTNGDGQTDYGWLLYDPGDPWFLWSRSIIIEGGGWPAKMFPSGQGDEALAQILGMQSQGYEGLGQWAEGRLPEASSVVVWTVLGACAAAAVVYRRRKAA